MTQQALHLERIRVIAELAVNNHDDISEGLCAVEYVNYVAGQPHSDRGNASVSEVLAAFAREANDHNLEFRRLAMQPGRDGTPAILAMVDTTAPLDVERLRAQYFVNLARRAAADALTQAGLYDEADKLRGLAITDRDSAEAVYGACVQINLAHEQASGRRFFAHAVAEAGRAAQHLSHPADSIGRLAAATKSACDAIEPSSARGEALFEALLEACGIR